MSEEVETSTQKIDSYSESIELRLKQENEMDDTRDETSADELIVKSVDERITKATDALFRRVKELCVLIASRTEKGIRGQQRSIRFEAQSWIA